MKRFLTRYRGALRFTLALLPLAAAAGYLMLRYLMALYDEDTMAAMVAQLGSTTALLAIGTVQTVIYVAVASFFGYILAEKLGLMRPLRLEKRPLLRTLAVSIPLGVLFSLDYWTFGAWLPGTAVRDSAAAGLTVWGWSSAALYGGVMEELLMRLFLMSLLAFLGWKLFFRREKQSPTGVIIAANVLAALLFPLLGQAIGFDTTSGESFGIFAGTAVNDTSSVTAAASTWDSMWELGSQTLDKAVTVKLTRTLAIIPITLVLSLIQAKKAGKGQGGFRLKNAFPMFILWFVCASVVTTICTSLGVASAVFQPLKELSKFFIIMAMAAIGLNSNVVKLVKSGGKPLLLGACCWAGITAVSLLMQHVMGLW